MCDPDGYIRSSSMVVVVVIVVGEAGMVAVGVV